MNSKMLMIAGVILLMSNLAQAQAQAQAQDTTDESLSLRYGNNGFEFETSDKRFLLQLQSRLQFRFATPGDQNPLTFDDFINEHRRVYKINRARLKVGGHAYQPWLKYYWEYELAQSNLLDFRIMIEKWDFLKFKIGQWKTYYNRERVISSGQQQMMDRSILTRPFTIDRQQGLEIYGRIMPGSRYDFNYNFSILTGSGRGEVVNDDTHLMYVGRLQWNVFGRALAMTGSDVEFHQNPTGILALAAATNDSPYTRFSQSGGGQLEGYEDGVAGQYRVDQWMVETAFMWKGFSWQQEFHHKSIQDDVNNTKTKLLGNNVQAGYFFSNIWEFVPEPLEVAARYAFYNPSTGERGNLQEEYGLALNWFFVDHRNKLTAELTYFDMQDMELNSANGARFRLQWDISF